jgi:hypothetical protein
MSRHLFSAPATAFPINDHGLIATVAIDFHTLKREKDAHSAAAMGTLSSGVRTLRTGNGLICNHTADCKAG